MDDAGEAPHGPFGDFHDITRLQRAGDLFDELAIHLCADVLDDFVGHMGEAAAEFYHVQHTLCVAHGPQREGGVEPGEKIAREESFNKPHLSPGCIALKFDAGAVGG